MRLCYIADANSIHTRRWVMPFIYRGDEVYLISYKPVKSNWVGLTELVDLTHLFNVPKIRFVYWGWWIRQYVKKIKPDILHAHQLTGAGWLGSMANFHPLVASAWGSDILAEPQRSRFRWLLTKIVMSRCDQLTVPSQIMFNAAKNLGCSTQKLHLIPWGVETDIFQPEPDDSKETRLRFGFRQNAKIAVCTRAMAPLYNIDILVNAAAKIREKLPDFHLVLLKYNVDQEYFSQIQNLISINNLAHIVTILPPQNGPKNMAKLYRMADIAISIPTSEGYGFSVFEAMACGCPTVISELPIFRQEMVDRVHTMFVGVRDESSTVDALLELLGNDSLHRSLQRNGILFAQKDSVARRLHKTDNLYHVVTSQGK